jgi:hypothetical protein
MGRKLRTAHPIARVSGSLTCFPVSTASSAVRNPCCVARSGLGAFSILPR